MVHTCDRTPLTRATRKSLAPVRGSLQRRCARKRNSSCSRARSPTAAAAATPTAVRSRAWPSVARTLFLHEHPPLRSAEAALAQLARDLAHELLTSKLGVVLDNEVGSGRLLQVTRWLISLVCVLVCCWDVLDCLYVSPWTVHVSVQSGHVDSQSTWASREHDRAPSSDTRVRVSETRVFCSVRAPRHATLRAPRGGPHARRPRTAAAPAEF